MLRIGLTGGIASGKTTVGEMFVALGARLIEADKIAHELMTPGQKVYDEVVAHFGPDILNPDATINRARLANLAFSPSNEAGAKSSRIEELNRIVHPAVIRTQEEWMDEQRRRDPKAVVIVEAALILEAGVPNRFDKLIVVTCSEDVRVARFAARHKMDLEAARKEVQRRMAAQLPDAEKIKAADYVIDNSGTRKDTNTQVDQIWNTIPR